jgi:hypothetical protein
MRTNGAGGMLAAVVIMLSSEHMLRPSWRNKGHLPASSAGTPWGRPSRAASVRQGPVAPVRGLPIPARFGLGWLRGGFL